MAKKAHKGAARGDIVRCLGGWWHINSCVWNDGETYLLTPLSDPYWPERRSLGPPQVVKVRHFDEVIKQGSDPGSHDVDPLKGSGR